MSRNRELIERYVDALIVEMKRFAGMKADLRNVLYFLGGGTPTAVPADLLRRFLTALRTTLGEPPPMSTVEAKPVTATEEKLQAFYDAGFRRVNFGVQTLDPELYAFHHQGEDLAESFRAIERARRVGFEFINIDIMTGLETQTLASWETTLTTLERLATTGEIDSVFIYPFHDDPRSRTFERPQSTPDPLETTLSEVLARRMFQRLGWRELGSRFFRSARHVRRELLEWAIVRINPSYGEILYHGFGNSSFSVGDRAAYINRRDVRAYCDQIDGGKLGISHYKRLDDAQRATRDLTFDLLYSPVCRTRAIRNKYGAASMDDHDARLDRWAELGLGQRERVLGVWRLSDLGKLVHLQMIPQMYLPKDRRPFAERMLLRKQLGKRYRGY